MTKTEIMELFKKSEEGEQLVPVNLGLDGGDSAISIEKVKYRGRDYYDIGLDVRDTDCGEPIDVDFRLMIGKEFFDYTMARWDDDIFNGFVESIKNRLNESTEEVPAE